MRRDENSGGNGTSYLLSILYSFNLRKIKFQLYNNFKITARALYLFWLVLN